MGTCYFVIIIFLFLGLAIFKLRMAREIKPALYQVLIYTLLPAIADPRVPFTPRALARLQRYIDAGGNLLIAGEPGKQQVLNPIDRQAKVAG